MSEIEYITILDTQTKKQRDNKGVNIPSKSKVMYYACFTCLICFIVYMLHLFGYFSYTLIRDISPFVNIILIFVIYIIVKRRKK